jgi:hypothetical protein
MREEQLSTDGGRGPSRRITEESARKREGSGFESSLSYGLPLRGVLVYDKLTRGARRVLSSSVCRLVAEFRITK